MTEIIYEILSVDCNRNLDTARVIWTPAQFANSINVKFSSCTGLALLRLYKQETWATHYKGIAQIRAVFKNEIKTQRTARTNE